MFQAFFMQARVRESGYPRESADNTISSVNILLVLGGVIVAETFFFSTKRMLKHTKPRKNSISHAVFEQKLFSECPEKCSSPENFPCFTHV